MIAGLFKPEYLYRPQQLLARLFNKRAVGHQKIRLPWGQEICVSADDNVGGQVVTLGLYDLVITEALWRLLDKGEHALDIGANIGYTTFVMANRIGNGCIESFEPHPVLNQELNANVNFLLQQGCGATIKTFQLALGSEAGNLPLYVPKDFAYHRGESSLAAPAHLECSSETVTVPVETLDAHQASDTSIGVMKIDVEGFELEVLNGATKIFEQRRVRDCVFEEHASYPTPVTAWFEAKGYSVFRLDRSFSKPRLLAANNGSPRTTWTATNFLATIAPARAHERFSKSGWQCLRGQA